MYLNAHILVYINNQLVQTIVSVETTNDGNAIGASCEIVLPLTARIAYQPDPNDPTNNQKGYITVPSRTYFNTGDHIVVKAKYEGYEKSEGSGTDGYITEFEGFLYDFYETTPLKIKCLDYVYWFNLGIYGEKIVTTFAKRKANSRKLPKAISSGKGASFASIDFIDLIKDIILTVNNNIEDYNEENSTDFPLIELSEPFFNMKLVNITFQTMSPAAILEWFKKELGFNISLLGNKLYVNVASNTTGFVVYKTNINVIQSNLQSTNLQHRNTKKASGSNSVFLRVKVKAWFIRDDGTKDSFEVGDKNGQLREVFFYKIKRDQKLYEKLANEALLKFHHSRYTGEIETYLYPYCELFWKVDYTDVRYPERNGTYVITMKKSTFNENGFHRKLKLAVLDDLNIGANAG